MEQKEDLLISTFYQEAAKLNFEVMGLYTARHEVLSLGSDSKLIGRIFEIITEGMLEKIAKTLGWGFEESESQTCYPDYTLNMPNGKRIAVDIKTTYRSHRADGTTAPFGFTLGAYASFLRNGTKNISHPYSEYVKHYVIGFVYDRVEEAKAGRVIAKGQTVCFPYENVEYFMQEKYKIAGDKPGSGDTENIGTIKSADIAGFREGNGIFAKTGNAQFEDYWRGYPKYRSGKKDYTSYDKYLKFKGIKK
jgi:hypothetical protein